MRSGSMAGERSVRVRRMLAAFMLMAALSGVTNHIPAQSPLECSVGQWEAPFDHPGNTAAGVPCYSSTIYSFPPDLSQPDPANRHYFNAVHMNIIPKGLKRGWLLVWNTIQYPTNGAEQTRQVHYALLNPEAPISSTNPENYCANLAAGVGDFFCSGHVWTANGELFVAGGTRCHDIGGPPGCRGLYGGSKLTYLWKPPMSVSEPPGGQWQRGPDLDDFRWYPSVVALGPHPNDDTDRIMILGGVDPDRPS